MCPPFIIALGPRLRGDERAKAGIAPPLGVTPAKAGVQSSFALRALDTGLRRYDEDSLTSRADLYEEVCLSALFDGHPLRRPRPRQARP